MNIVIFLCTGVIVGVLATYFSVKIENKITQKEKQLIEDTVIDTLKALEIDFDIK